MRLAEPGKFANQTNQWKSGTKWNGPRQGVSGPTSWMGAGLAKEEQLLERAKKYGASTKVVGSGDNAKTVIDEATIGINRFAAVNEKGEALPNTFINIDGRTYQSDGQGRFTIFDMDLLNEEAELASQIDEQVNKILKVAGSSDATCYKILKRPKGEKGDGEMETDNDIKKLLDAGSTDADWKPVLKDADMPETLPTQFHDISGLPSFTNAIDDSSREYGIGVSKLKMLVKARLPLTQSLTKGKFNNAKEDTAEIKS